MLRAYADEHVNPAIVLGLRRRGMDVATASEKGLLGADDEIALQVAATEQRLMLTYDEDFLVIHAQWLAEGRSHSGIVFWPGNRFPIGRAIDRIAAFAATTSVADAANRVEFLKKD